MQVEDKFRARHHDEIACLMNNAGLLAIIQDVEGIDEMLEQISRKDLEHLSEYCFHALDTTTFIMETLSKLTDGYRSNNITDKLSQEDFLKFTSKLTALSGGINSCVNYMHLTIMELLALKGRSTS
ncbi:hypothetical protein [Snodgrassella alvi]|uniref:Uncharacterized protein n=1 Tax=Snodgrassella alvi TaxID=1196083 RepID=A0A2N9WU17_9NEIS|nr:hypothetical protein [Snodgrassella alvi]PIT15432.1 hypothetical protein BGI32_05750 [Snodgrassella alvi]PIT17837.1 hypothetical protein BGI33_02210 [Snodgrassella alvi]PIT21791.1 hypothetical protein BGI34_00865 [Snodgrassella alvi]